MDYLVYLFYPLLIGVLFYGGKVFKKSEWNEEVLSLEQTKAIEAFAAICIMFHHMAQKTCAYWMDSDYIVNGLNPFVMTGYLFVAIFFFFSGYGLIKSYKTKENYLQRFLPKRLSPLFVAAVLIGFVFLSARVGMKENVRFQFFSFGEPRQINPNGWFPIAITVLYIGFYLSYRFCKNKKVALGLTCAVALAYIVYCDFFLFGTWWYNTIPAFCAGLIFAEYEKPFIQSIKKHYILNVIILCVLNVVFIYFSVQHSREYNRFVQLLSQMASSVTFVLLLIVLGLKVKIGNKALAFIGGMTLELYLIHGLFVHLFGYCFITEQLEPLYYIANPALYAVVVICLSIPSAYLFKIIDKAIIRFFNKRKDIARALNKDVLKVICVLCGLFLVAVIINSYLNKKTTAERNATVIPEYIEKNITFAQVDGGKMAADIAGEGEHTIVMLSPIAPTLALKELQRHLKDEFKVVLLDPLGTGFSDRTDKPRTTANIVSEIHEALNQLGIDKPFILVGHMNSGIYTMAYANTYPQDLEEVIGIDSFAFEEFAEKLRANNLDEQSFYRINKRYAQEKLFSIKFLVKSGLIRWMWPLFEDLFITDNNEDIIPVFEEGFKTSFYNENTYNEALNEYNNYYAIEGMKYPEQIPSVELIGFYTWEMNYYFGEWKEIHERRLSENPKSYLTTVTGDNFSIYWNVRLFTQQITNAVHALDK